MNATDTPAPSPEGFDPSPPFDPLLCLAGAFRETLRNCPSSEISMLRTLGLLLACQFIYFSGITTLVAHHLFARPGEFRIDLTLGCVFLGCMLTLIDSTMIIRSSFFRDGEEELKRAGCDIVRGGLHKVKHWVLVGFRAVLSISVASLIAIGSSLILFGHDINARIDAISHTANAQLIAAASTSVDADKARAVTNLQNEEKRYNALSQQALAARQNQLDPLANDPLVQQAQGELTRLSDQKARDDEEIRRAERFESDEKGGLRGNAQNSGRAGNGPRHRAALDQLFYARAHARTTARELAAAQTRLDDLRTRLAATADTQRQKAVDQTPEFEKALAAEGREHDRLKAVVAQLNDDRDGAIRKLVEQAPGYVPADNGLLMQLKLLEEITGNDRKLKALELLIEIASFGFELAAVLAKTMSYAPMSYTARLARDVYLRCVAIVDETAARLAKGGDKPEDDDPLPPFTGGAAQRPPLNPQGGLASATGPAFDVFGDIGEPPAAADPPKRKRGRPRKNPLH